MAYHRYKALIHVFDQYPFSAVQTSVYCFPFYCVSKQVSTFELSVTSSNLNRFSKFLHCRKAYNICYKTHTAIPTSPQDVTTLPWEIKKSFVCRYSANMEEHANKF